MGGQGRVPQGFKGRQATQQLGGRIAERSALEIANRDRVHQSARWLGVYGVLGRREAVRGNALAGGRATDDPTRTRPEEGAPERGRSRRARDGLLSVPEHSLD